MSRFPFFTCVLALFVFTGAASPSAAQTHYLNDGNSAFVVSGTYSSTSEFSTYSSTVGFAGESRYAFGLVYSSSVPQTAYRSGYRIGYGDVPAVRGAGVYSELRLTSSDSPARFTTDVSVQRIFGQDDLTGAVGGIGFTVGRAFQTGENVLVQPNLSMGGTYQSIGRQGSDRNGMTSAYLGFSVGIGGSGENGAFVVAPFVTYLPDVRETSLGIQLQIGIRASDLD